MSDQLPNAPLIEDTLLRIAEVLERLEKRQEETREQDRLDLFMAAAMSGLSAHFGNTPEGDAMGEKRAQKIIRLAHMLRATADATLPEIQAGIHAAISKK